MIVFILFYLRPCFSSNKFFYTFSVFYVAPILLLFWLVFDILRTDARQPLCTLSHYDGTCMVTPNW